MDLHLEFLEDRVRYRRLRSARLVVLEFVVADDLERVLGPSIVDHCLGDPDREYHRNRLAGTSTPRKKAAERSPGWL